MTALYYGLAALGGAVALVAAALSLSGNIAIEVYNEQLLKLIRAGNADRARKLARAGAMSGYGRMMLAVFARAESLDLSMGTSLAGDALREAFTAARAVEVRRARRLQWLAVLGFALAAGGGGLGFIDGRPPMLLAAPALALLMFSFTWRAADRLIRASERQGPQVVDALVDTLAAPSR